MDTQIVKFKENPMAGNLGLELEGRSKFPGCTDAVQPARGRDGRWVTGLDEMARSIINIRDQALRESKQKAIKAERESLESLMGIKLDGLSDYWNTYLVEINPAKQLDLSVPSERIAYLVILASGAVAPSVKDTMDPLYNAAKYFVFRDFEDVSGRVEKKDRYADALTKLKKLLEKPEKAIQLGIFLDLNMSNVTPPENVRDMFYTYLESDEKLGSVEKFLDAVSRTPEEIGVKLAFSEALKLGVIRQRDGVFQRGNITLGRSSAPNEVVDFLKDPKNSGELLSIQEEIVRKRKFG